MDFAVIGTISSYVKQKNLSFAAKHKIRTGQTLTDAYGNWTSTNAVSTFDKLREAAQASNTQAKAQKLARIKRKLRDGQKLSDEELGFLRVNDPKTYKKAKHADEAREELKAELKRAKSKSEAREAMSRAMVKASADAMAELGALAQGGGGVNIGGSMTADGSTNAAMTSGGEVTLEADGSANAPQSCAEISGADNQSLADENQSIQASGERATEELSATNPANHDADKNSSPAQKNSDDDKFTPEDIMEKFIWTVRALEDEWAQFTNSDEYKNLPDHLADADDDKKIRRQIPAPDRRLLNAATAYRRAMSLGTRGCW
ncbi:MAG: hypothetical protein IKD80_04385 [Selenomonadaceae bacterium]|nr:hypothetical protein [Selenomonadaceae bacterium]